MTAIKNQDVAATFKAYPAPMRAKLLKLRQLILDTAAKTEGVGKLDETLKWRQPSYLTNESHSGSTIRIDQVKADPEKYALYVHCQSGLVDQFRELYPSQFMFEGKRALIFDAAKKLPEKALCHCIALALTYHARRRSGQRLAKRRS